MFLLHIGVGGSSWLDWVIQPDVLLLCALLGWGYFYTVTRLRERVSDAGRVTRSQAVSFSLGILMLYAATGGPMHQLADTYLASAHMLQHILLMLVVAPLLLAGIPSWVWQALLRRPGVLPVARTLTHPVVALAVFNAVLLLTHLPSAIDLQLHQPWAHVLVHVSQVGAGLLMWWPILSTVPELPRISYPAQMGYLFLQSLLPSVMAAFITFSDTVIYTFYEEAPRIWDLSAISDQQIAGLIMKLLGSLILWSFIVVVFFRWYEREGVESRGPRWGDVAGELEDLGLTKR